MKDLTRLVDYAIWAPSGHNSQPWKFRVSAEIIEILPDYNRVRPAVDPYNRELFISLGAAAKNIEIAAENEGLIVDSQIEGEKVTVRVLGVDKTPKNNALMGEIKKRRTNREDFWEKEIEESKMKIINQIGGEKLILIFRDEEKWKLANLVSEADLVWFKNRELMIELEEWLRDDMELTKDGLSTGILNLYKVATELKYLFSGDSEAAKINAERDKERTANAPLLAIITTNEDKIEDWVEAGKTYQELALRLGQMELANSFLNRPLELAGYRKKMADLVKTKNKVQLLIRIGYAKKEAKKTPRRPIEEVLIYNR